MAAEGHDAIIFLDKNRIYVQAGDGVIKLDVPDTIIRDVDVIDKSGFDTLVDNFIKTKKLEPSRMWVILPDTVCFTKDFSQADVVKSDSAMRDFLEAIPYDQVISKKYRSGQNIRIIATNLEYIEAVTEIFERNGFLAEGIIPGAVFPGYTTKKILDAEYAKFILENKSLMRAANMFAKITVPSNNPIEPAAPQKHGKMLPYLIAGFVVLIIILGVVLFLRK
jgi:hypothetical protein